jgi:transcriptional regulator with XRE-family HTH domain
MKRKDLLSSPDFWLIHFQNELFGVIEKYLKKKKINRTQLAKELNVSKGYVTQILNGDYDHKVSKMVELSLACGAVPLIFFVDKEEYINADAQDKVYETIPILRGKLIHLTEENPISISSKEYLTLNSGELSFAS